MGLSIPNFAGHKKISELSVVPLRCLPNGPQITSDCVKRGRRWIDLWSHVACQDYEGDAEGDKEPEHVSGYLPLVSSIRIHYSTGFWKSSRRC